MLRGMTPEQFDEIVAMDRIIPFGDEKVCWTLARGFAQICFRLNLIAEGVSGAKDLPILNPRDFIPWKKARKTQPADKFMNPNQQVAAVQSWISRR